MTDKELFGNSEQLNCSDCVNHGGDWDCDHVHCRKGADTISRQAALKGLESLNVASFYEDNEHSKEAYHEIKQMLETLPTVDAVPVAHGWWKAVTDDGDEYKRTCSCCGEEAPFDESEDVYLLYPHCPWCGASLDIKGGDGNG